MVDMNEPEKFPRFELSSDENVCLIAAHITAGRWMEIGMDEPQAMTWLLHFLQSLKGQASETVPAIYTMMRNVLMAHHKTDFLGIQLQPPFLEFARSNTQSLATALHEGQEASFKKLWQETFSPGWYDRQPEHVIVTYDGGPGDAFDNGVAMHAPAAETSVHAEYWYLFYRFGRNWRLGQQMKEQAAVNGKFYDCLEVIPPHGAARLVYFDITHRVLHSALLP